MQFKLFITLPAGAMAKYCNEHVCVSVSASISPEPHVWYLPNFLHTAYGRGSVLLQQVTQSQG